MTAAPAGTYSAAATNDAWVLLLHPAAFAVAKQLLGSGSTTGTCVAVMSAGPWQVAQAPSARGPPVCAQASLIPCVVWLMHLMPEPTKSTPSWQEPQAAIVGFVWY